MYLTATSLPADATAVDWWIPRNLCEFPVTRTGESPDWSQLRAGLLMVPVSKTLDVPRRDIAAFLCGSYGRVCAKYLYCASRAGINLNNVCARHSSGGRRVTRPCSVIHVDQAAAYRPESDQ